LLCWILEEDELKPLCKTNKQTKQKKEEKEDLFQERWWEVGEKRGQCNKVPSESREKGCMNGCRREGELKPRISEGNCKQSTAKA